MSDTYTEVTSENYFERLKNSLVSVGIGLVMFVCAGGLLVWNESRAVDALKGLAQAAKEVTEASPSPVDASQNGKLVHLTGDLKTSAPLSDPTLGMSKDGLIHLKRFVEMYQWKEHEESSSSSSVGGTETKKTTYTYTKQWSEDPIDSGHFKQRERHDNPSMPIRTHVTTARDATLGDRKLSPELLDEMSDYESLQPPATAPDGYRRDGDVLYSGRGSAASPEIGDLRVTFSGVPVQTVSVMAAQRGATLAPFRTSNNYKIGLVSTGDQSASAMVAQKRSQEKTLTWILRAVGFALFFFSLLMISSPLSALANVLPFVASIIGGSMFVFAFGLAIPLTLVTIAVSWLAFRPVFGIGLLVAAGLCIYGYRRVRPRHVKPAAPVAPVGGLQGGAPA